MSTNRVQIEVAHLSKSYQISEQKAGFAASLKGLVRRRYSEVVAVQDISFEIREGERVGFLGPNGAGKTTTLKMLAGLLHPTAGQASVAGYIPWQRRSEYLRSISMVLGNKSQLLWDIPAGESFKVLGEIYHLQPACFKQNLAELVELLELQPLLNKPVRTLSLGERMKCELAAGLLHSPQVLFLDEPTLGLDVSMQNRFHRFIEEYNRSRGATVMLTSHYMNDVVALCSRVILIHRGQLLYDGDLDNLARRLAPFKLIKLVMAGEESLPELPPQVALIEKDGPRLTLRVAREETPYLTAYLLNHLPVVDLSVEDPPVEAVIDQIYQGKGGDLWDLETGAADGR